jgi:uncharacterized peroxidase-related enzyme
VRLAILEGGQRLRQRLALLALRVAGRADPDPVAKLSLYRPEFFGRAWLRFIEHAMRGSSAWSDADRELIGAFVSTLNSCPFCVGVHSGLAGLLTASTTGVLEDIRARPDVSSRLRATFDFLERVNTAPDEITEADIVELNSAGVSADAIADALYVAFQFNAINRIANAFDFRWADEADRMAYARGLRRIRYHIPGFVLE